MSVTSPTDPRPLPIGVTEGQQFVENHLLIYRSGATANGLGGPINFSSEVANKQPRNLFEHIDDSYRELGLRRYRCAYFFNSHYTLTIPNLVVYIKSGSVNTKSHISFSFGTAGIKGSEPTIPNEFTSPNVIWNSAQARQQASFLPVALKPRDWVPFWIREILDFEADTTPNNYFAMRAEAKDPIAITPKPDFNLVFVGNMGCGSQFDNILGKMKSRNPSAYFFLGNMSYGPTGDCWINRVANLRPIHITFGAYDWYKREFADRIDDDPYPRVPPEWYWPNQHDFGDLPDCDDDLWEEWNVGVTEDTQDEENEADKRYELKGPSLEEDENDNPVEKTIGVFNEEINAKYYLEYLKSCEIFPNDVDRDRFNEGLQNQYRSRFGLNSFEGMQAYYIGNAFILILNSNAVPFGHVEDSPQYQYAKRQLEQADDNAYVAYKIVLAYRPGYVAPNGTLRGQSGDIQTGATGYQGPIERFNKTYQPLFQENHVTLYINGNVMNYQRTGILSHQSNNWFVPTEQSPGSGPAYKIRDKSLEGNGIIYLTVGTGGAGLQNNQTLPSWIKKSIVSFGYLVMTSVGNGVSIEMRFYDNTDKLLDFFTIGVD